MDTYDEIMSQEGEAIAAKGLNINGYLGKWRVAQLLAMANERSDEARLLPYWERVRLLFLELGGEYTVPISPETGVQ